MSADEQDPSPPPPASPADEELLDDQRLLGAPRTLRRRDVSRAAGVSLLSARRFWRALGFAVVEDDVAAFTESDVRALHGITGLVRDGLLDEVTALGMTRAVGRSVDRLATWQVQLLAEHVSEQLHHADGTPPPATPDSESARRTADLFASISDELEPLVVYAWRRQVASALARIAADAVPEPRDDAVGEGGEPGEHEQVVTRRSVGFADLVQFTRLVRRLSERELAVLVQRFEALTSDVVTSHGGRVVKTVGDEVLYVVRPGPRAAAIALDIVDVLGADDLMPDVRIGMATGPVLGRLGDVFGTTVNRASRLTAVARPGSVLVDVATVHSLAGEPDVDVRQLRGRSLRGIGHVVPWLLRRPAAAEPDPPAAVQPGPA